MSSEDSIEPHHDIDRPPERERHRGAGAIRIRRRGPVAPAEAQYLRKLLRDGLDLVASTLRTGSVTSFARVLLPLAQLLDAGAVFRLRAGIENGHGVVRAALRRAARGELEDVDLAPGHFEQ